MSTGLTLSGSDLSRDEIPKNIYIYIYIYIFVSKDLSTKDLSLNHDRTACDIVGSERRAP